MMHINPIEQPLIFSTLGRLILPLTYLLFVSILLSLLLKGFQELHSRKEHLSGKKLFRIYFNGLAKLRETQDGRLPIQDRTILYRRHLGILYVNWGLSTLFGVPLEEQERDVLVELRRNLRKFKEIAIESDNDTFMSLSDPLIKLGTAIYNFNNEPSELMKEYLNLKKIYEQRPEYLKQSKSAELFDINNRWNIPSWVMASLFREAVILTVLVGIILLLKYLVPNL